jgi:hypothetical protein
MDLQTDLEVTAGIEEANTGEEGKKYHKQSIIFL